MVLSVGSHSLGQHCGWHDDGRDLILLLSTLPLGPYHVLSPSLRRMFWFHFKNYFYYEKYCVYRKGESNKTIIIYSEWDLIIAQICTILQRNLPDIMKLSSKYLKRCLKNFYRVLYKTTASLIN